MLRQTDVHQAMANSTNTMPHAYHQNDCMVATIATVRKASNLKSFTMIRRLARNEQH